MALVQAGVQIFPGTDTGVPGVFPGSSLHREIVLLTKLGLPPEYVLSATTSKAAEFLGLGDRIGRIEAGYEADLILVRANPIEEMEAISDIVEVFAGARKILRHGFE